MKEEAFSPKWLSPPGDTIADLMKERSVSLDSLASRLACQSFELQDMLVGETRLTTRLAGALAEHLGGSKEFWLRRDSLYWEDREKVDIESASTDWLQTLPIRDMRRWGWLGNASTKEEILSSCLAFFGVQDVLSWHLRYKSLLQKAAFRTSPTYSSASASVLAWLRQGEIQAERIHCAPWDPTGLERSLPALRKLTRQRLPSSFLPEITCICAANGVAFSLARCPSGCRASGAARFLGSGKASITLSFRYLTDDHFWFTLFHEIGHLLLHSDKSLFIEDGAAADLRESEANGFASCTLIPEELAEELPKIPTDRLSVRAFARRAGVSPGIVVGQLQHRKQLRHNELNMLKVHYTWGDCG